MPIDFNNEPYYDDFAESKKFYKILYRPGFAVQARELTQMQTILQNQISRFGDWVYKEGAMVVPGNSSVDVDVDYVKLQATYNNVNADTVVEEFVGLTIVNATGLQAEVIHYAKSSGADPATLFVRYKNSGTSGTEKTFGVNDIISDVDATYTVQAAASAPSGKGSLAIIELGIYYIKGHFVLVEPQTIVLDKYTNTPTYRIGLTCTEQIITSEEDETLFDNAQNSFNYAAPGAHRFSIDSVLTKLTEDSTTDTDFIELIRVKSGQTTRNTKRTENSGLEKTLADRTYDESGNYTVKNFELDVREFRNNNRSQWVSGRYYLSGDVVSNAGNTYVARNSGTSASPNPLTPPIHAAGTVNDGPSNSGVSWEFDSEPFYNRGINSPGNADIQATHEANEAKLAVGLEPGRAYIQGYLVEKPSTTYVTVPKARDAVQVENAYIPSTVGNYVLVTNVNSLPPISTFGTVTLYDRLVSSVGVAPSGATAIGTARVRLLEWHNGTIGTQTSIYKLGLFDVKMNGTFDFNRKVKSVFLSGGTAALSFSANIDPILGRIVGSATAANSATITGTQTSFQTDLIVGDVISFGGVLRRVDTITSQSQITVDTAITITGSTMDRVSTVVYEPENTSLVYPLPYYAIKNVRGISGGVPGAGGNDTNYTVYQQLDVTTISGGSINPPGLGSGVFASAAETDNYIVLNNTTGGIILPTGTITGTGTNTLAIPVNSALNGNTAIVIAAVNKTGSTSTEKTKLLQSSVDVLFTTQATAQDSSLSLGVADGYRLVSVKMRTGTFAAPTGTYSIDITDRYEFDSGQRSTHYDIARVNLKNSYAPPEAPITVTFDHFTHTAGDYFTRDSYPNTVDYKLIPSFNGLSLRDCIDFRPRINNAGTEFSSTGASVSLVPKRGIDIITDFAYYLARKSKIALDLSGKFVSIDSVSSLNPGEPADLALGLSLYSLNLEPYTFGTTSDNVVVTRFDNKRYTMRDIGKLEKRIDNLEYYTSLSLLEQQTESLEVIDSDGDTRFKRGFIVDNFSGHNTGDTTSPDYLNSIDMENAELRPFYSMNNINLVEKNSTVEQRNAANYKLYGDVITLPVVSNIKLIEQPYATRLENINPFAVFTFLGDVKINPSSDDWFEIDRRPDLVIDVEGNYNTVKNLAEKAGVLGSVWNAWQTSWRGTPVTTQVTQRFSGEGIRVITTEQTATQVGQTRTGVKTTLVAKIDRQVIGDRVLQTAVIPYIRSRNILVQIQKLKPSTRFYPFFDGIDIAQYCTPASKIVYVPVSGTFNTDTNVGSLATGVPRRIAGDAQVCLNRGDIITGGTSGATAVVVGKEYNPDTNAYALFVVNIIGTFSTAETITGSVSGATGTVGTRTLASTGGNLVSNINGDLHLLFNIPNTDALRFRCGSRELRLVDVPTSDGLFTSRARANYHAEGILETRQQTVHSVRNAELVEEQLSGNQVIVQNSERVVADSGWFDPLAQTFLIEQRGGCFLSKVDIYFATKDLTIPVMLEIREVVNGYPGKLVLPFSRVTLKPEQVNAPVAGDTINTAVYNTVTLNGTTVAKWDAPTTFTFPSPVYVQENTEYAIVLASDSNAYNVWISQVGEQMPGTARTISEQPYLGSLFKSQNASTWTADQTQDLKFALYRAQFNTGVQANVEYENDIVPLQTLDIDPFETRVGQTKVRVHHRDHGIPDASRVILSGVAAAVNGIPIAQLNTTHIISDVDLDSYVITVTTAATTSGYGGGSVVKATRNLQYDGVHPGVQIQSFSDTKVSVGIKTITGKSVDSSTQTAYSAENVFTPILANENNYFYAPRMVASQINEEQSNGGNKSLTMNAKFSSTNDALSPILDTHRTSMILFSNKVNTPLETNTNVSGLDDNVILSNLNGVTVSGSTITTTTRNAQFKTVNVGKYLTIAGATSGTSTRLITAVAADGSSITFSQAPVAIVGNATLTQRERFVDEIAPHDSSTYSKYVTKTINVETSNFLRVRFAVNLPLGSAVEVYYKTAATNASFNTLNYTLLTPDKTIVNYSNGSNTFVDVTYSGNDLPAFDTVKVKIVMKSTNSSEVPRIKDLRIIACA